MAENSYAIALETHDTLNTALWELDDIREIWESEKR